MRTAVLLSSLLFLTWAGMLVLDSRRAPDPGNPDAEVGTTPGADELSGRSDPSSTPPRPDTSPTPAPPLGLLPFQVNLDPGFPAGALAIERLRAGQLEQAVKALNEPEKNADNEARRRVMLGALLLTLDQPKRAADLLEEPSVPEVIADDVALLRARALLEADRPDQALQVAAAIPDESPVMLEARQVQARACLALDRATDAIQYLAPLLEAPPGQDPGPDLLLLWADAHRALEGAVHRKTAVAAYQAILTRFPLSRAARTAERALEALLGAGTDALSSEQKVEQARALVRAGYNRRACNLLAPLFADPALPPALRCDVAYTFGVALQNRRHYTDAVAPLTRAEAACDRSRQVKALFRLERGFIRRGSPAQAEKTMRKLLERFPDHSFADDALYMLASDALSDGKLDQARKLLEEQVTRYPDGDMRGEASWRLAWIAYRSGAVAEAIAVLEARLADAARSGAGPSAPEGAPGDTTPSVPPAPEPQTEGTSTTPSPTPRATPTPTPAPFPDLDREHYWVARWHEVGGMPPEDAADAYAHLVQDAPESCYGMLAFARLHRIDADRARALAGQWSATMHRLVPVRLVTDRDLSPPMKRAVSLIRWGLLDQAAEVLEPLADQAVSADDLLLPYLLDAAGKHTRSHDLIRRLLRTNGAFHLDLDHRGVYLLGYPRAFESQILEAAASRSIDPLLLFALVREESGFNPAIRSWAGAIGLAQLMPATARTVAQRNRMPKPSPADLSRPEVNLALGAAHLRWLLARYAGHPGLAIAAYNAGAGAVDRWLRENQHRPFDEFLEEIPYRQTRAYTARVLEAWQIYHLLYDPDTPFAGSNILTLPRK